MNLNTYQEDFESDFKIYCIEAVDDVQKEHQSKIWPYLEQLSQKHHIHSLYKSFDSMETLIEAIEYLLDIDKEESEYLILYFILTGQGNEIIIDGIVYRLEELAEIFEGRFEGKTIHFSNTKSLELEEESFQYFLDLTKAKALSGYTKSASVLSAELDMYFFSLHKDYYEPKEIVHAMYKDYAKLYHKFGFRLYY